MDEAVPAHRGPGVPALDHRHVGEGIPINVPRRDVPAEETVLLQPLDQGPAVAAVHAPGVPGAVAVGVLPVDLLDRAREGVGIRVHAVAPAAAFDGVAVSILVEVIVRSAVLVDPVVPDLLGPWKMASSRSSQSSS